MFDSRLSSASTRLVFPAPDGATTTKRLPLLNVLYLLPHLLDQHLQLHRNAGDFVGDGLGAERVRLAVELLAEEVESLAAGAALVEDALHLGHVGDEARELLVHVDARGVEHYFLGQALIGGRRARLGELRRELFLECLDRPRHERLRLPDELADSSKPVAQDLLELGALALARLAKIAHRD